jgi:hypothetical protein
MISKPRARRSDSADEHRKLSMQGATYIDSCKVALRYDRHPKSLPRDIREGVFPPPTLRLSAVAPRWSIIELDRWDDLLASTGDPRAATAQLLAERATRLADVAA